MPGRDSGGGHPKPSRIPSPGRASCDQLEGAFRDTPARPEVELLRICQRLKNARCGLQHASRSLRDLETQQAQERVRRIIQAGADLLHPTAEVGLDAADRPVLQPFASPGMRGGVQDQRPGSVPNEAGDSDTELQRLRCEHDQLKQEHAVALNRIKDLEILVQERWRGDGANPVSLGHLGTAQPASTESKEAECEKTSLKSAQGYQAIAAQLAKEVVKLASQFKDAETLAEQQDDRRRFIFWAEHQVAPFIPML